MQFENLKNLNRSENASCSKVPDVGIQKNHNQITITPQHSKKRSEFAGPRNRPKMVQICALDHNDQI